MGHTRKRHIGYMSPLLLWRRFLELIRHIICSFLHKIRKSKKPWKTGAMYYMSVLRLAAEGDTADRESEVPVVAAQRVDVAWVEVQVVGVVAIAANRGPVVAVVACVAQVVAWVVVLLVGRAGFHRLYMARMLSRSVGFSWVNLHFGNKAVASGGARRIKRTPSWSRNIMLCALPQAN